MNISSTRQRLFKLLVLFMVLPLLSPAQNQNTELLSRVQFGPDCNDIWGWVDEDGREYALVGLRTALAIIDVSDPRNPVEVTHVSGASSTWRDIKTWNNHAFVTNETGRGLQVIDLSQLSTTGRVTAFDWTPSISGLGTLSTCHNIFIDEFGIAYLAGSNLNAGGPIFVDVTTPSSPRYVGKAARRYAHDVYVRDNIMYSSDIYNGQIAITDVSDKSAPVLLGAQTTPSRFTHNAWLSDDGRTVYTTDERSNAPVAAYDVSNPNNISKLFEFRSKRTVGSGVIPHNVHVLNDWLVISNYTDGVVIVDAKRPENLIEVGNYDTESTLNSSFRGAWGAYPFLPSGNILVSDIKNGLFVIGMNYKRAAYLEGVVRDGSTGQVLNGVDITINSTELDDFSTNLQGEFRTGLVEGGTYRITFSKNGYNSKTVDATLINGELTYLEVNLIDFAPAIVAGMVTDTLGNPIEGATIRLSSQNGTYFGTSDSFGGFLIEDIPQNEYNIYISVWGYLPFETDAFFSSGGSSFAVQLQAGYFDDFSSDLGWSSFSVTTGFGGDWERDDPTGLTRNGTLITPDGDLADDKGDQCYVTGRDDTPVVQDEVSNGFNVLASPMMDLSAYEYPMLSFHTWFYTEAEAGEAAIDINITNGADLVTIATITESTSQWERMEVALADFLELSPTMQLSFEVYEMASGQVITEAAIDGILVIDSQDPIEPPSQDTLAFYLEAECAVLGDAWELQRRDDASNALYAVLPWQGITLRTPPTEDSTLLRFSFDIATAGEYEIYTRTQANNIWHNSFWVRADEGTWIDYENIPETSSFEWNAIHDSAAEDEKVIFNFEAGAHTLDFGLQEDGTRLDKLFIVSANTIEPEGLGEEVSCFSDLGQSDLVDNTAKQPTIQLFPNPTSADVILNFQSDDWKTIEVYSIKGALLQHSNVQSMQHTIDLSGYNAGLYILTVIDAAGVWQEQVVKQ